MILSKIIGKYNAALNQKIVDSIFLEWYECSKRILHKRTEQGRNITLRFLDAPVYFQSNDIVFEDEHDIIVIQILPCKAMVIRPADLKEMAAVCYELGNKHLPLFYEEGVLSIPFDKPVYTMLLASGLDIQLEERILRNPLRTSVLPHAHESASQSLFSRILKLSSNEK
jgi:urease accessory protein